MIWPFGGNAVKKEISNPEENEGMLKILTIVILKLNELQKILEISSLEVDINQKKINAVNKKNELIRLFNGPLLENNPYIKRIKLISDIIEKKIYFPIDIEKTNIQKLISETKTAISKYRNKL